MRKLFPAGAGALALLAGLAATPGGSQQRMAAARAGVSGLVRDIDGHAYQTVVIGGQEWMVGNLKTTRLNDGTPIEWVTDAARWTDLLAPAYTWYNNDPGYQETLGALYNWYAVATGKLCPQGWRVPTDADWQILVDSLGGKTVAGGKLKSDLVVGGEAEDVADDDELVEGVPPAGGTSIAATVVRERAPHGWRRPNTGATNETRFGALPGGQRMYNNGATVFRNRGNYGFWWTGTEASTNVAWYRLMYHKYSHVSRVTTNKSDGLSVCCVRD